MSVTFAAAPGVLLGWDVVCVCGAKYLEEGQALLTRDEVDGLITLFKAEEKGLAGCEEDDCFIYGLFGKAVYEGGDSPEVNMSNMNSVALLEVLGLKTDEDDFADVCCGSKAAEDFKGRVLMALAVAPVSAERVTEATLFESGAMMVTCGVEEGYVQEKLEALLSVADFALSQGVEVCWG